MVAKPTSYDRFLHRQNGEKWCGGCQCWISFDEFHRSAVSNDGLQSQCRICMGVLQKKRRSKPENKVYNSEYMKNWHSEHIYHDKMYYMKNRDRILAANRKWQKDNPEKWDSIARANEYRRRSHIKNGFVEYVSKKVLYERDKAICGVCGEVVAYIDASIDHIVPVSRGGKHSYDNTQLAHLSCNKSKGASVDYDCMEGGLDGY